MPRKLPWEIHPPANNGLTSPSKKRKRDAPESSLGSHCRKVAENEIQHPLPSEEQERSPSPELLPPPSPLREGLDGDDIYIVVEDELYLTARKFAAPLHASAYRKWQAEKASRGPDWKPEGIGPETSAASVKAKEEDSKLQVPQKSSEDISKRPGWRRPVEPIEGADDWGKGVLADLLRGKSKLLRDDVSLVGLDGVRSRTKSALLAERAQRRGRSHASYNKKSRRREDDDDLDAYSTTDDTDDTTTDDDDDDDLDILVKKESQYTSMSFGTQRSDKRAVRFAPLSSQPEVQRDAEVKLEKSSQVSSVSAQRPIEDLDFDFPAPRALKTRTSLLK